MSDKLYILDVSGFLFRAYFALPPMANNKGEATHALFGFVRSVIKLFKDFGPDHIVAIFDGPDNKKQRKELYDKYKEHRKPAYEDLPRQMEMAHEFCALIGISTLEVGGVEADDTMGSVTKWAEQNGYDVYLCTGDKDLAQLVNERTFLLNPWKENLILDVQGVIETFKVKPEQITDYLAIVGDQSDNIPGIKGLGPKAAEELLKQFSSLEEILDNIDKVSGPKKQELLRNEKETAILSKKLATIYTDVSFPKNKTFFEKKKPRLDSLKAFYSEMDFNSLLKEMDEILGEKIVPENVTYRLIESESALKELVEALFEAKEIALDTETNSLNFMEAKPIGIGFSIQKKEGYYVPLNTSLDTSILRPLFENKHLHFYCHNVKFDYHALANIGIDLLSVNFDTMIASQVLHSSSRRHSLDELALSHFGKVKIPIKSLIGSGKKEITMDLVPVDKVAEYCCEDVDYTYRLKEVFDKEFAAQRSLSTLFYDLELPLIKVIAKMERNGIFLDPSLLETMSKTLAQDIEKLQNEIFSLAGETFNISSPKQLSTILFEKMEIKPLKKTATGLSTNAEVLEALALEYPIAKKILEYRTLEKLKSTYIDALPLAINPKTQRIHSTFNQAATATGRLSCQDPNLQNIPVKTPLGKEIRKAFRPQKEGWQFLAADYSQIELRLLAHMSEESALIDAFNAKEDIHIYTASLMFEVPLSQVTPSMRSSAKAINFGIIYGQQAYGLSQGLNIDIKKAAAFIEAYFIRYPEVQKYIEKSIELARKTKCAKTLFGRVRELPEILSNNAILRAASERLAVNTPLQGTAADLIKQAMLNIDALLTEKKMESFLVLQIHDELIFEAPKSEIEELSSLVKREMECVYPLKVPLVVDVVVGKNWGEC